MAYSMISRVFAPRLARSESDTSGDPGTHPLPFSLPRMLLALVALLSGYELILVSLEGNGETVALGAMLVALAAAGPWISRWVRLSIPILLLLLLIVAHLWFGNIDIGPFALRSYVAVTLVAYMGYRWARYREPITSQRSVWVLLGLLGALIGWRLIAVELQSLEISGSSDFVATLGFAGISFVAIQRFVRTADQLTAIILWLLLVLGVSSYFALLQWIGFEPAWDAALHLRPGQERIVQGFVDSDLTGELRFAPGLTLFSIQLSYQLVTFGLLGLAWLIYRAREHGTIIGSTVILSALGLALVVTQSRSAIAAAIVAGAITVWLSRNRLRSYSRVSYMKAAAVIATIAILSSVVAALVLNSPSSDPSLAFSGTDDELPPLSSRYSLGRVLRGIGGLRSSVLSESVDVAISNPLYGISQQEFSDIQIEKYPDNDKATSPHNFFLNPAVHAGFPAVLLVLAITALMLWTIEKSRRSASGDRSLNWIGIGALAGFVGFLLNSQAHNDGIFTDGTILWWLTGFAVALLHIRSTRQGGNSGQLPDGEEPVRATQPNPG